jgi:hypothetical protein
MFMILLFEIVRIVLIGSGLSPVYQAEIDTPAEAKLGYQCHLVDSVGSLIVVIFEIGSRIVHGGHGIRTQAKADPVGEPVFETDTEVHGEPVYRFA